MYYKAFFVVVVLLWSMVIPGGLVLAQGKDITLEPVVVTATKTERAPEDVTQSVTVITADEIKKSGATTPSEAVRKTVGMTVNEYGPRGAISNLSVRGSTSAQVLVLLDGKRLNSPRTGGYNLSDLPVSLDDIERIEIVRGSSSALYGADAVGGVINIITKKPEKPESRFTAEVGTHGYDSLRLRNAGKKGDLSYTLSAGRDTSDGYRRNSDLDQGTVGAKIGYEVNSDSYVELSAGYIGKEIGVPGSTTFPSPLARQWVRETVVGLSYQNKLFEELDFSLHGYYNRDNLIFKDPDSAQDDTHTSYANGVDAQVDWFPNSWNIITAGVEGRKDTVDSTASGNHDALLRAGYLQDEISFGKPLIVIIGGRYDSHSVYDDEFSPRISARYLIESFNTILRASAGKGFRAPTFNDLYFNTGWAVGNPALKPETSKEYEGSIEQRIGTASTLTLGGFERKVENLIVWNYLVFPMIPENIGRANITGIEAGFKLDVLNLLTWAMNYTYINPVDEVTGEKIYTIPEMKLNTSLNLVLSTKTNVYLEGRMTKDYEEPGEDERKYFVADAKITRSVSLSSSSSGDVFFGVKNIFDRSFEVVRGYPMAPREIYGGMSGRF